MSGGATWLAAAMLAAQAPLGVTDPAVVLDGFDATCRSGFPDLAAVATAAATAGFVERRTFVPRDSGLPSGTILPRMFQKSEAMLSLIRPNPAFRGSRLACSVSATAAGKPDPRAFAETVRARLALGEPTWSGNGSDLQAEWQLPSGLAIRASTGGYRKLRSFTLQVRRMAEDS